MRYGAPRVIDDPHRVEEIVERLTAIYEASMRAAVVDARSARRSSKLNLLKAIVGFEMPIERLEGKFKFGQNRPLEDQLATLDALEKTPASSALARLARRHLRLTR